MILNVSLDKLISLTSLKSGQSGLVMETEINFALTLGPSILLPASMLHWHCDGSKWFLSRSWFLACSTESTFTAHFVERLLRVGISPSSAISVNLSATNDLRYGLLLGISAYTVRKFPSNFEACVLLFSHWGTVSLIRLQGIVTLYEMLVSCALANANCSENAKKNTNAIRIDDFALGPVTLFVTKSTNSLASSIGNQFLPFLWTQSQNGNPNPRH